MRAVLWYVLTGTRGGSERARILRALDARPRPVDRLAGALGLPPETVRHHLDVLAENGLVERMDGREAVYRPTDQSRRHWDRIENLAPEVG